MNVLSLFDGIGCGRLALRRAGIHVDNYFASEIDAKAMSVASANFPDIKHIGNVKGVSAEHLPKIDLLMGGSPCQGLSIAGKRLRFDDPRSALFWEFVRLVKELKPKYFLLENVKMRKEDRDVIEESLGVDGILINSALVSCQNRERWYWTNIPHVSLPMDRHIYVKDILEPEVDESFWCSQAFLESKDLKWVNQLRDTPVDALNQVTAVAKNNAQAGRVYDIMGKGPSMMAEAGGLGGKTGLFLVPKIFQSTNRGTNKQGMKEYNGKLPCITTSKWQDNFFCVLEQYGVRRFTPVEAERAQTLPDNYTAGHAKTARYKMIGNAWTVDVVAHILNHIPEDDRV